MLAYFGEDEVDTQLDEEDRTPDDAIITDDLSHLKAFESSAQSHPFCIVGSIDRTPVTILINTGSTYDFMHSRFAESLKLPLTPIKSFRVYVGNDATLNYSHVARGTKLSMQGIDFSIDFHILDIHGLDVILGMAWLDSLGKVSADFVRKTLEFQTGEQSHIIRGSQHPP